MAQSDTGKVLKLLTKQGGILRARELDALSLPRIALTRLEREGAIRRVSRGIYLHVDADLSEHFNLAMIAKRVPQGLICLRSALQFHELTTQNPHQVWLAVDNKAHIPTSEWPPLRVVRFTKRAMTQGTEIKIIDKAPVRVTSPARTVIDCFKYPRIVELGVALEALEDYLSTINDRDALWRAAEAQKITGTMRPYLEALS